MIRLGTVAAMMIAGSAFATGERVALTPGSPLKETLCFSMECTTSQPDVLVVTKQVKGGLEVTVTTAAGHRRLTTVVPMREDGTLSSTELVHATTLVLKAIEEPNAPAVNDTPKAAPKKLAKRPSHKTRMFAHR